MGIVVISSVMRQRCGRPAPTVRRTATTVPTSTPVPLGPQGQPELQALVFAGKLGDLRWPDFPDYQGQATLFYAASGYAPAWINDGRPTAQASAMIDAFRQANTKGLNPEDYDVSRWGARIAKLAPATASPAATDLVHFDLALTICAMRYLSDLSIGRVNPNPVKFGVESAARSMISRTSSGARCCRRPT